MTKRTKSKKTGSRRTRTGSPTYRNSRRRAWTSDRSSTQYICSNRPPRWTKAPEQCVANTTGTGAEGPRVGCRYGGPPSETAVLCGSNEYPLFPKTRRPYAIYRWRCRLAEADCVLDFKRIAPFEVRVSVYSDKR